MRGIFYHATDVEFKEFDKKRMASKGASNGHLGVWATFEKEKCEVFGDVVMKLEMPDVRPFIMSVQDLLKLHSKSKRHDDDGAEMYRNFVNDLIDAGYNAIYLTEMDGEPSQAILIDIENINVLEHIPSSRAAPPMWS